MSWSTTAACSRHWGLDTSTTWSSRSAKDSSSSVALKASTRWWGSLRIKPTVSDRSTVQVSEISRVRVVVSSVSNRRLLAGISAPVSLFSRVDLPALV